jgi:diguanylate cyclase (GGDEF)-like protein/PAS domain S-box-containing protein
MAQETITINGGVSKDDSDRKSAGVCQAESMERFRAFFERAPLPYQSLDMTANVLDVNDAWLALMGETSRTDVIGRPITDWLAEASVPTLAENFPRFVTAGHVEGPVFEVVSRDGHHRLVTVNGRIDRDASGTPLRTHCILTDITERKRAEQALKASEERLRATLENAPNVAVQWYDRAGRVIYWNAASEKLYGWSAAEALGQTLDGLIRSHEHTARFLVLLREMETSGKCIGPAEYETLNRAGEQRIVEASLFPIPGHTPDETVFVCMDIDITEKKRQERQLQVMAHFDALTGLPNRVLLADRMRQAMAQAQRHQRLLSVAYIDLDGFKPVNDRHGHAVGDQLLVAVAQRLQQALREGDTVARLGGDEFVVILLDLATRRDAQMLLDRLLVAAAEPFTVGDLIVHISASMGVTFYPQDEETDADQLLRQADHAMYQAKLAGRNCCHTFDSACPS